jgi:hypothetical protein
MGLLLRLRSLFRKRLKVTFTEHICAPHDNSLDRALSVEERAIAEWLLQHDDPPATPFLSQLDVARVVGRCSCGCPTVYLEIPEETPPAGPRDNPVGDATGEVGGKMVGVMMLQRGGYLTCLEVYDLSDIERPYGLPNFSSLRPFNGRHPKT